MPSSRFQIDKNMEKGYDGVIDESIRERPL